MSETITAAEFSKAKLSEYAEFFHKDIQPGKKVSVFVYVGKYSVACMSPATVDIMVEDNITKVIFYTDGSSIEFNASDVTHIDHGKSGGRTEWEVKTKHGISFEIIPK